MVRVSLGLGSELEKKLQAVQYPVPGRVPSTARYAIPGGGSKRWTFSETMDIHDFTVYYSLCVSRRIDTWHLVYLSNKDLCPKILAHKSEIKVP